MRTVESWLTRFPCPLYVHAWSAPLALPQAMTQALCAVTSTSAVDRMRPQYVYKLYAAGCGALWAFYEKIMFSGYYVSQCSIMLHAHIWQTHGHIDTLHISSTIMCISLQTAMFCSNMHSRLLLNLQYNCRPLFTYIHVHINYGRINLSRHIQTHTYLPPPPHTHTHTSTDKHLAFNYLHKQTWRS